MNHETTEYNDEQRAWSRFLAEQLRELAGRNVETIGMHGIASAFIGVGVECALRYLSPNDVARWLRMTADELDIEPRKH